jgi:hypothetical protein
MKKPDRHSTKLRLALRREIVLHLDREQLAQVGGATGQTACSGCVILRGQGGEPLPQP